MKRKIYILTLILSFFYQGSLMVLKKATIALNFWSMVVSKTIRNPDWFMVRIIKEPLICRSFIF